MDQQPTKIDSMIALITRATELSQAAQYFGAQLPVSVHYMRATGRVYITIHAEDAAQLPYREVAAWQLASGSVLDKHGSRGAMWDIHTTAYSHLGKPMVARETWLTGELDGIVLTMVEYAPVAAGEVVR